MVLPTLKKLKRVPPGVPMRSEFLMLCLHVFTCAFTGITHELRSVMRSLSSQRLRGFMWPLSGRLAMQRVFSTLLRGSDSGLLIYIYIHTSIHPCMHACKHAYIHAYMHAYIHCICKHPKHDDLDKQDPVESCSGPCSISWSSGTTLGP